MQEDFFERCKRLGLMESSLIEMIDKIDRYEEALKKIRALDYSRAAVNMSALEAVAIAGNALEDRSPIDDVCEE